MNRENAIYYLVFGVAGLEMANLRPVSHNLQPQCTSCDERAKLLLMSTYNVEKAYFKTAVGQNRTLFVSCTV